MERIMAMFLYGVALSWSVLSILGQLSPGDEYNEWTGQWNYTWELNDEWALNNSNVWQEFPNITEKELKSKQVSFRTSDNGDGIGCNTEPIYESQTLRVYQCTLPTPVYGAKSRVCGDIPSQLEYSCDWSDTDITLCHQWRDRYTQSLTFCTSEADTCSDRGGRQMICSCSIFYSWTVGQYFTFCDCKGSLTQGYDDSCAFSYFGLLETPDQGRTCHSICSRRSDCKECSSDQTIPSPGVVTYCMCENTENIFGSREICPCPEESLNNTACREDYETFSGQCSEHSTISMTTSTHRSSNSTTWTAKNRIQPDIDTVTTPGTNTANTTSTDLPSSKTPMSTVSSYNKTTEMTVQTGQYTTETSSDVSTEVRETSATTSTDGVTSPNTVKSTFPKTTHRMHTVTKSQDDHHSSQPIPGRFLSDRVIAAIIFCVIGLIIILILILLILLLCLRLKNRGNRKESICETTAHADEFTLLRNSNQIRPGSSVMTYDNRSIVTVATEESCGSIYKDYFHVIDGANGNQENLYYFKVDRTPNGSISGLEYKKQPEKALIFGSTASVNAPLIQSPGSSSQLSSPGSKTVSPNVNGRESNSAFKEFGMIRPDTTRVDQDKGDVPTHGQALQTTELSTPEMKGSCPNKDYHGSEICPVTGNEDNPYYFKLGQKQKAGKVAQAPMDYDYNSQDYSKVRKNKNTPGVLQQESIEENPYYFKVDPKKNIVRDNQSCAVQSPIVLLSDELANADKTEENDDYQSLLTKKKIISKEDSDNNDASYLYLLKPTNDQCDDDDYMSLRKMKTKVDETQERVDNSNSSSDNLNKEKEKDFLRQFSNTSDSCSEYFSLLRTMASGERVDEKDEESYLNLKTEGQLVDDNDNDKGNDYQHLKKNSPEKGNGGTPSVDKETDDDYQLLRKRSQKQTQVTDEGDGNDHDYQVLKRENLTKEGEKDGSS